MRISLALAIVLGVCCLLMAVPALAKEVEKADAGKAVMTKAEVPAGQQVFAVSKCTMCHTVYSAGIGEEPKTEEEKEAAKSRPPDLSLAGTGRTAEWLKGFLHQKEMLHEKQHMMAFSGTDDDLNTLVGWILTLKAPEEEKKPEKASAAPAGKTTGDKVAPSATSKAADDDDAKDADKTAGDDDEEDDDDSATNTGDAAGGDDD